MRFVVLAALLSVAGLAQGKGKEKQPSSQPADAVPVSVPDSYSIGPEDILSIRVWGDPNLSGAYAVGPDGKITLPLVGDVAASGLTRDALKRQLTLAVSKFDKEPEITIQFTVNSKKFYIAGEVNRQGQFPLAVPITVFEALNGAAQGFKDFANKSDIVILRGGKPIKFNYQEIVIGKLLEQNILLQNGDTIIVH
jgi:polysaccharide export outer membrane protein